MTPSGLILGIDPGLRITGYGLLTSDRPRPRVVEAGVLRSDEDDDLAGRIKELFDGLKDLISQYKPIVLAIEQLYAHYAHPRTAILMGHARGVLLLAACEFQIPVVHYAATRIKKTITGAGRASKEQMQRTIQRELGLAEIPEPPDVADALAVALCHYYIGKTPGRAGVDSKSPPPGRRKTEKP